MKYVLKRGDSKLQNKLEATTLVLKLTGKIYSKEFQSIKKITPHPQKKMPPKLPILSQKIAKKCTPKPMR